MQPLSTRAGTAGPHTAASPCPLCPLCPLCPGAAKIVRRYASHCTNLQTTAHPSDAVVSVRQVAFAGELSIRHKTVRQNSCNGMRRGGAGHCATQWPIAPASPAAIVTLEVVRSDRSLCGRRTLVMPVLALLLALLCTPAQPLAHAILTRSRPKHRPTPPRCAILTSFDRQPAGHCVLTLQNEL